jgi:hypothetical protein
MPLASGSRIGLYEIISTLGAGGMGEVYRARDTKLNRDVAIKVLLPAVANDPDRLVRFSREAQVLASLNHPNIGAIYGLEESDGIQGLVLELVEGPTLADRVARGPMPVDEVIAIALQIVDALGAAHEQGIVHRDLKPANIKLRPDGSVKVLDFGLAKAIDSGVVAGASATMSPTLTGPAMTQAGIILGTAAYMSPEQARGHLADKRSDIWAFGCVLYEMLTGERAFAGEDVSETLAAVLKTDPDLTRFPPRLRPLVAACLERDPKKRLRDIGDAPRLMAQDVRVERRRPVGWPVAAAVAVLLAVAALPMVWRGTSPPDHPLMRLDVDLGPNAVATGTNDVVISPDGKRIVFSVRGSSPGTDLLATRRLDGNIATPLPGTEGGRMPFFSPDNRWIGFVANGRLHKVSVEGGAPVALSELSSQWFGASWGEDDYIVAGLIDHPSAGLLRIPSSGSGAAQPLTPKKPGEIHQLPQVLPGGRVVVFSVRNAGARLADGNVEAVVVATHERTTLASRAYSGQYLPSMGSAGHLLYIKDGALVGARFDPSRLQVQGEPVRLIEAVLANDSRGFGGQGSFSSSNTGTFVYRRDAATVRTLQVLWLDRSGKTELLLSKPADYSNPSLSVDGRLAVTIGSERGRDVWVYDPFRNIQTQITNDGETSSTLWTPNGRHVIGWRQSGDRYAIALIRADGSGEQQTLLESNHVIVPSSLSPDGRLLYFDIDPQTRQNLWTLPIDWTDPDHPTPGTPESFLHTPTAEFEPAFSPDGHWIAYRSGQPGESSAIYVRPFQGSGELKKISSGSGNDRNPMWSRDGKQLFFESGDNQIMVVDYTVAGDLFKAQKPRPWTDYRTLVAPARYNISLAPDGKRFVVIAPVETTTEQPSTSHATFLLNFFDELRRRAPTR